MNACASGSLRDLSRKAFNWSIKYSLAWPARFGYLGWMEIPSTPWQLEQMVTTTCFTSCPFAWSDASNKTERTPAVKRMGFMEDLHSLVEQTMWISNEDTFSRV